MAAQPIQKGTKNLPQRCSQSFAFLFLNMTSEFQMDQQTQNYKEMKRLFKKTQKPYTKQLKIVEKCKYKYYKKSEQREILRNQMRYALEDNKLSASTVSN